MRDEEGVSRVEGWGGSGFQVPRSGFKVPGSRFKVQGSRFNLEL
jgi:hypothetical protein